MGNIKAKTLLQKLAFADNDRKSSKHEEIQKWVYRNARSVIEKTVMSDNKYPFEITTNKWEHEVVYSQGNYTMLVGFIDLLIYIKGTFHTKNYCDFEHKGLSVFIEVKSVIPDLGELIRQMRAYQTFRDNVETPTKYLIVSPDDRHEEILIEQGFYFYKYNDPEKLF